MRFLNRLMSFIALAAVACGNSAQDQDSPGGPALAVEARAGETFRLRVGGIARVGADFLVSFQGVSSDSRCPIDVDCVWQGDAVVHISAAVGRMQWTPFELHTGLEPRSVVFQDRRITLIAVEPAPRSNEQIDPARYIITLKVD